jgi:hypothetical protein
LDADQLAHSCELQPQQLQAWQDHWNDLPADLHLRDGGRYRQRRHSCFVVHDRAVHQVPHRAHWQPVSYNALHGGIERWFEPMQPAWVQDPAWLRMLAALGGVASALFSQVLASPWYVEAHPFRITTEGGIGRPTPEGAHRDGVDLVVVAMVQRHNIKGGETRVFAADGPQGVRFTLSQPWSALFLDDARVIHESTPIQNQEPSAAAWRDTLVLTFRRLGFQDP